MKYIDFTLKIAPKYFEAQLVGLKNFEIRKDDHEKHFNGGDIIRLAEWENGSYTGRKIYRVITYVTDYEQKPGYVVLGTKPL
ncbi:DUF3850 domain-containing protein [Liquorilactobacillus hordei]|uniref:DUF3850 domain-containing protein n=1 Tax=Liquorilactobacillus hordei TaxID=468911 RepID=UPI0039EC1A12